MNPKIRLLYLFILSFCFAFTLSGQNDLFMIEENNLKGFINYQGEVKIKPQFWSAADFSEGLAAARKESLFGYIDTLGQWAIKPQFGFAKSFHSGIAKVYDENGNIYFIDKKGKKVLDLGKYEKVSDFENDKAYVTTKSTKQGIINTKGKLIVDTIFDVIYQREFNESEITVGRYVKGQENIPISDRELGLGLIDTLGNILTPFIYSEIRSNGSDKYYSVTTLPDSMGITYTGILDKKGNTIIAPSSKNRFWIDNIINDSLLKGIISLDTSLKGNEIASNFNENTRIECYMNFKGEWQLQYKTYRDVYYFHNDRAFRPSKENPQKDEIINQKRERIGTELYEQHHNNFINGYAVVKENGQYGIIDTNANWVFRPQFQKASSVNEHGLFTFRVRTDSTRNYITNMGIGKASNGTIIFPPTVKGDVYYDDVFKKGLCYTYKDFLRGKLYIDTLGRIVWEERTQKASDKHLNIDYMPEISFFVHNTPLEKDSTNFKAEQLQIKVSPEQLDSLTYDGKERQGMKVVIANRSNFDAYFKGTGGSLYTYLEAVNENGKWQRISPIPTYFRLEPRFSNHILPTNHCWDSPIPKFEGAFKTKIRVVLEYIKLPKEYKQEYGVIKGFDETKSTLLKLYSNEFESSLNPSQFWLKFTPF